MTQKPNNQRYPKEPKKISEHIRKRRLDLGLKQREVAKLMEASEDYLCYWENERNGDVRREDKTIQDEHVLNNENVAKVLGVGESRLSNWERNRRVPAKKRMKFVLSVIHKSTT